MTGPARGRRLVSTALLGALALAGCAAGGPHPSTETEPALERALDRALRRQAWNDLRLDAECHTEDGWRSATLFGSGVGVWNRERQLVLPRAGVLSLLQELAASRFPALRETYGEGEPEAELICRVRLDLDGASKQVQQLSTGPQFAPLSRLAGDILAAAEAAGRAGREASSLTDGLEQIARGELAPELLTVHVLRQSEAPGTDGWNLTLEGGTLTVQRNPAPARAATQSTRLPAAELSQLAGRLAAARLEELPVNLWASAYTDLEVRVLGHARALQARQFAGMTPATHGELQQRFDRLWETLEDLRGRPDAGRPSP